MTRNQAMVGAGLLATALLGAPLPAHADLIFSVSGQFFEGASITGSMAVDVALGNITSLDIDVAGIDPGFYDNISTEANGPDVEIHAANGGGTLPYNLTLVVSTSLMSGNLMGFTGGTIVTGSVFNPNVGQFIYTKAQGFVVQSAPEPSILPLLAIGFGIAGIGYGGLGYEYLKKRRRAL